MQVLRIIPHHVYVHPNAKHTVSIWGAAPIEPGWEVKQRGWTYAMDDGTVGACRAPAKTYNEAVEVANGINERERASLRDHAARFPDQAERLAARIESIQQFSPESA